MFSQLGVASEIIGHILLVFSRLFVILAGMGPLLRLDSDPSTLLAMGFKDGGDCEPECFG